MSDTKLIEGQAHADGGGQSPWAPRLLLLFNPLLLLLRLSSGRRTRNFRLLLNLQRTLNASGRTVRRALSAVFTYFRMAARISFSNSRRAILAREQAAIKGRAEDGGDGGGGELGQPPDLRQQFERGAAYSGEKIHVAESV